MEINAQRSLCGWDEERRGSEKRKRRGRRVQPRIGANRFQERVCLRNETCLLVGA
jgi:hypothetical protein